jgi:hypothetical protein
MLDSLRTPALVRYTVMPEGAGGNEIVHITDMFTTLVCGPGWKCPRTT